MLHDQKNFYHAVKVVSWNRIMLSALGLWPLAPNNFVFTINFVYLTYHMFLKYLDLFLFIDNLEIVIENLTENMAFTQIFTRIVMLKKYNQQLGVVINEAIKDYDASIYKNSDEIKVFMGYINKAKLYVKFLSGFTASTAAFYYLTPLLNSPPVDESNGMEMNTTMPFILPYRFHLLYEINDQKTYMLTYASQLPFVYVSGFGQAAADCLMVTLVFHVCGKLGALAHRITQIPCDDAAIHKTELNNIIIEHNRLLNMGQSIQEAFSETLLVHLIGATALVCILGFQLLSNYAKGRNADLATFLIFIFLVFLVLYAHCVVGESLRTESGKVCEAYYDCKWYDLRRHNAKSFIICMAQSQKPLGLVAGKFGEFCLSSLTVVMKTAMAYLSVLRSLLMV